jgi:beta-xylosidase
MPGLPILHSKDLVNWKIINYALKKLPQDIYDIPQPGKGVWAPAIIFHNGLFYIYYPDPDFGVYVVTARDPAAEWSKPVLVLPGKGIIDPAPFWDTDGKAYLTIGWAASRAGVNSLLTVFKMNAGGTSVIDDGKHVYDGHGIDPTTEGPKMYKINGFYYILCPAGGVATGWQLALRSKNIYGPYERKVVMDQGSSNINGPHQGGLVQTQTGEWWFLHFQDKEVYGRIIHLQPVSWKNNWPVMGKDDDHDGKGEPVSTFKKPNVGKQFPVETPVESDEFNSDTLGLQWQWNANPKIAWYALIRNTGFLRLFAYPADSTLTLWNTPNLLLQKFPAPSFTATTKVKLNIEFDAWTNKKAGLVIMGYDYASLNIAKNNSGYILSQVSCKNAVNGGNEIVNEQVNVIEPEIWLRVSVSAPSGICHFSYSTDGKQFKNIGTAFTALQGKWIGAKLGLFCTGAAGTRTGSYADIDWFRITND